jgi:ribosomal protein S18 acetylase RimI-like enzyme
VVEIREASDEAAIASARELFLEYEKALGVDLCFQGFAAELDGLPGDYARPGGRLLIAGGGEGQLAGCVALRPLGDDACEMKRLYVRPAFRSAGVGRALVERVIAEARATGYRRMYLDTLPSMGAAQRLYQRLGFRDVAPYRENPVPGARFLALDL